MSRNTTKSPFAEALEGLLDATELYTRREWAKLLGIKDSAISQWLSEETIPRASDLNMIYVTVEKASDAAEVSHSKCLGKWPPTFPHWKPRPRMEGECFECVGVHEAACVRQALQ